ncbi:MAG: tripartite tricarboxylate transporter TctB family protein [Geminicoccaceae bacterium]
MMTGERRDFVLGLAIAAFGAVLLLAIIPQAVVVPKGVRSAVLSPAFWPRAIAGFLILSGLLLAIQSRLRSEAGEVARHEGLFLRLVAALVLLLAYYWAIRPLGMVVASMIAIMAFGLLGRARNIPVLAAAAVILPLLLYGFFVKVAGLPIPTGRWISFP